MKANARAIVASLDLWFKGLSLAKIQDHLRAFYEVKVTRPAIYGWIRKYVELLDIYVRQLRPKLSGKWHADETQLKVNGQRRLLWNMLDNGTRFWIANCLTHRRRGQDAKRLINKSLAKAKRQPKALVTDGLGSYAIALQETVNRDHKKVRHVAKVGLSDGRNNIIESFHGTLRERTKVMRGLDNRKSAQLYAKGMNVFYNYIRPHTALDGATPAEAAGIHLAEGDNRWLNLLRRKKQDRLRYA
jgi:transposase-like protein